ncbi:uncharacterized protein DNG_02385 [Cephalotrichum gorgonifer]|uniref:Uncharacterized protein n=1 Tax=Cephalotrichum gorgonifer TaxID=2041049 RepID=A0AAE8ST77_9PEZI|nr:uncharacterized protein DNG_02385 [Cephalotrichum gorgonifer]
MSENAEMSVSPEVSTSDPEASISSLLSKAVALINSHSTLRRASLLEALEFADKALNIAVGEGRADLEGRAHLVRGHCLRGMGFWSAASKCYEKAARCGCGCTGVVIDGRLVEKE